MKLTQKEFLDRSYLSWSDKYDYENTFYTNMKNKVIIRCVEHGTFSQYPSSHMNGEEGCKVCKKNNRVKISKEGFKICSMCHLEKNIDYFYNGARYCKSCSKEYASSRKEYHKNFYYKNKDNILKVRKEYVENNKDKISKFSSKYYEKNKEKIFEKNREYYEINKNKICKKQKEYYEINKGDISSRKKEYAEINKEKLKEYGKKYRSSNVEKLKEYRLINKDRTKRYNKEYINNRLLTDPFFKFIHNLKASIRNSISKMGYSKKSRTYEVLGITYTEFKEYIENLFQDGMSWDNHGDWHLDHKIPISWGKTEQEVINLNHYSNLQPLWSKDNLSKGNRYKN